jgi:hypothetical protein
MIINILWNLKILIVIFYKESMLCYHKSSYVDNLRMSRILFSSVHSSPHRRWQLPLGTPLFYSEVIPMDAIRDRTYFHLAVLLVLKPQSHHTCCRKYSQSSAPIGHTCIACWRLFFQVLLWSLKSMTSDAQAYVIVVHLDVMMEH